MPYIKSPMNYTGGKYKLLNTIIPAFPEKIDKFVDLFCGGLNVGINVNANTIYANDQITYIIDLYKYFQSLDTADLIKRIKDRIREYNMSSDNKDSYIRLRNEYNRTGNILDLFVLTCFSYNNQIRFNSNHEFNTSFGMRSYNDQTENNLIEFCNVLCSKNFILSSLDFRSFDFSVLSSGDIVYCDPPYSISTAAYNDGKRGFNGWSEKDDLELFELLDSLSDKEILFALSDVTIHKGMTNDALVKWAEKYNTVYIHTDYSGASCNLKDRYCDTQEVLITNYNVSIFNNDTIRSKKLF
jgi:DNA adenine methylase